MNRLKQLGIALHCYADDYGSFPPAYIADKSGKPMHSWRVLLLPYMDYQELYDEYNFDEPWNGPSNSKLHGLVAECYRCPSEESATPTDTCYVAVTGPNTLFTDGEPVKPSDITYGNFATVMIVETSYSSIHWMEPRDMIVNETALATTNATKGEPRVSSDHGAVANVLSAGGSVRFVNWKQLTAEKLKALSSRNGGEDIGGEDF